MMLIIDSHYISSAPSSKRLKRKVYYNKSSVSSERPYIKYVHGIYEGTLHNQALQENSPDDFYYMHSSNLLKAVKHLCEGINLIRLETSFA